jgi:tetratricopeptide (TPR) repeat protein
MTFMQRADAAVVGSHPSTATPVRTTNATIAMLNLHAQIEGLELQAAHGQLTNRQLVDLLDALALRGQILGRVADHERAALLAEPLADTGSADGVLVLARARTRACLHRFAEALADLDMAEGYGVRHGEVDAERAAIFQAVGRYDEAMTLRHAAVARRADFESLAAVAVLHADLGEITLAEELFESSRRSYRAVSPFAVAQLDFQRGHMWQAHGDHHRAREWLLAAVGRLPAYAPAVGHLAEAEAALGDHDRALARLLRLAHCCDDPDYAAQLARLLINAGRAEEAQPWCARAAERYDDLVARHRAAFADHAAEFWLTVGGDPQRAVLLARQNVEIRRTPRAQALLTRAAAACQSQTAAPPGFRH